ncbi:MAG: ATP-binding protein [Actinobacteria bacterium]|nr:ATP-binding protein [Actinomycetota bacterium]
MPYLPRIVDDEIRDRLRSSGAVLVDGPKACGKTATARRHAKSEDLLDADVSAAQKMQVDPRLLLQGDPPHLLDEWQVYPDLWNYVRREVDARGIPGQFILTGSATPSDDATRHSGAGRFARIEMRPMSLLELGTSSGAISLARLFDGEASRSADPGLSLDDLIAQIVRGGWPGNRLMPPRDAARSNRDYLDRIRRTDIRAVDGVRRDPERLDAVLRSLARNVASTVSLTTIAEEASGAGTRVTDDTVGDYLSALARLMVIEDQPAWNTHLRSSHQLRTSPKRHFADPSLAVAAMRATSASLKADLNTLGFLFESLVVRDLRVYAQPLDGQILHYRDQTGLEVDAIVDTGDHWAAFEIKLGIGQIDQAANNLSEFRRRVDTTRRGEPALLGIIVGSGLGFVRPDGIHVIPVGALGA